MGRLARQLIPSQGSITHACPINTGVNNPQGLDSNGFERTSEHGQFFTRSNRLIVSTSTVLPPLQPTLCRIICPVQGGRSEGEDTTRGALFESRDGGGAVGVDDYMTLLALQFHVLFPNGATARGFWESLRPPYTQATAAANYAYPANPSSTVETDIIQYPRPSRSPE
ncbi:hypothetical protein BGZ61DRAFT_487555 [Ilyonectria robusta]|uniref:uncharacterized protein n=1 Tax=Ilyonectria robusta TaxID=1079257 RepID=UPI001E8D9885|nr:uncharacterized protein BGZ61DRAFT_487555 [Ilyonectria robusta]KAH8651964.1 hypothetical protein BGZ61DRAFT_487555 [Ilyonectria robusta]